MWVVLCDLFSIHIAPQLACIFTYGGLFHMYRFRLFTHQGFERSSVPGLKLLVFWFAGLFLGIFAVRFCGGTFVSSLSAAAGQCVSSAIFPLTLFPLLVSACGFDLSILRTLRDLLLSQFFSGADASGGLCMFSWLCCACGVAAAFFRIGIQSCSAVVLVAQTGKRAGILSIRYTDLHSRWNGDFPCGSLDHFSVFSRYCKFLER